MGDFTFKVAARAGDTEMWVTLPELTSALRPHLAAILPAMLREATIGDAYKACLLYTSPSPRD